MRRSSAPASISSRSCASHDATAHVFAACGGDRHGAELRSPPRRTRPTSSPIRSARKGTNATPRKAPSETRKPRSPTRRCGSCNARAGAIASGSSPTWPQRSSVSTKAKTTARTTESRGCRRRLSGGGVDDHRRREGLGQSLEAASRVFQRAISQTIAEPLPKDVGAIAKGCRRYALAQCRLNSGHAPRPKSAQAASRGKARAKPAHTRPDERIGV